MVSGEFFVYMEFSKKETAEVVNYKLKMNMKIRKQLFLMCCIILLTATYSKAQSPQKATERQKQQGNEFDQANRQENNEEKQYEYEQPEAAHSLKSQVSLNELLQLLQSKDLEYIDRILTGKGWKLHSTNIKDTEEPHDDYKMVTWSLDKNEYDDLAKGWFYFFLYSNSDNAISYRIADDTQLNRLKNELISSGYKKSQASDAIVRGFESVYRNNLYEVNFTKQLKKESEEGADISYTFYIFNFRQVEERKAKSERLEQETKERNQNYQNAIERAESAYSQKQYLKSKQAYRDAIAIKPENSEIVSDKIADIDIILLCQEAEAFFKTRQYEKAKESYTHALDIKPNNKIAPINDKLREIEALQNFLKERTIQRYDYKTVEPADYIIHDDQILSVLRKNLLNNESLTKTTVKIICETDTLGNSTSNFSVSPQNKNLNKALDKLIANIKLKPVFINTYSVSARAEYDYILEYNRTIVRVTKDAETIYSKNKLFNDFRPGINYELGSAPFGKYTFEMNRSIINGQEYKDDKLIKMRGTGGPSNMFLSLLIPGLGVRNVSGGAKSGIGCMLWTYGLIGAGVGCKFWSDSEYRKYHSATEQSAIDEHYNRANTLKQSFYVGIGLGATVWLYDIIWVAVRGSENRHAQKVWKRSHLNTYYQPNLNARGVSYAINF